MQFLIEMVLLTLVSLPLTKVAGVWLVNRYKLGLALKALEASVIYDAGKWEVIGGAGRTGNKLMHRETGLTIEAGTYGYNDKLKCFIVYNENQRLDNHDIPWLWRRRFFRAIACRGRMNPKQLVAAIKPQTPLQLAAK